MLIRSAVLEDSAVQGNWPVVDSTVHGLAMLFHLPRVIQYSWKVVWLVRGSRQLTVRRFQVLLPLSAPCRDVSPSLSASLNHEGHACLTTQQHNCFLDALVEPRSLPSTGALLQIMHCPTQNTEQEAIGRDKQEASMQVRSTEHFWGSENKLKHKCKHCTNLRRNEKVSFTKADAGKLFLNRLEEMERKP